MILSICRHSLLNLMEGKVERAFFFFFLFLHIYPTKRAKRKRSGKIYWFVLTFEGDLNRFSGGADGIFGWRLRLAAGRGRSCWVECMHGHDSIIIVFLGFTPWFGVFIVVFSVWFRSIVGGGGGGDFFGCSDVGSPASGAAVGVVADVGDDVHVRLLFA